MLAWGWFSPVLALCFEFALHLQAFLGPSLVSSTLEPDYLGSILSSSTIDYMTIDG